MSNLTLTSQFQTEVTPTLQQLLQDSSLEQLKQQTENDIKKSPADGKLRWLLFMLLCLTGDWQRALKQLQLCAQLDNKLDTAAQVYRSLIRCELFRQECLAGQRRPAFVLEPPQWAEQLLQAIDLNNQAKESEADACRMAALEMTNDTDGDINLTKFDWISDSDTWFGPVCEIITGGHYTWLPFEHISSLETEAPASPLELIWLPVSLILTDGSTLKGFLFSRYAGSEKESDALRLCRETRWVDNGQTSIRGLGQKTWQTDQGDFSLLDVRHARFNLSEA